MKNILFIITFILFACNQKEKEVIEEYDIIGEYKVLFTTYRNVKGKAKVYILNNKTNVDINFLLPTGWGDVITVNYDWFLNETQAVTSHNSD